MRWFRFYDEALDDPKVQRLPGELYKTWGNLLCLASRNGGKIPASADAAFALRLPEDEFMVRFNALVDARLIDIDESGARPHGWNNRQYESDSAAERMRRHRANQQARNAAVTAGEQLPYRTESESDTEQNRTEAEEDTRTGARTRFAPPSVEEVKVRAKELGNESEAAAFFDYYESKGWKVGKTPMKNWKSALSGWIRRSAEFRGGSGGGSVGQRERRAELAGGIKPGEYDRKGI